VAQSNGPGAVVEGGVVDCEGVDVEVEVVGEVVSVGGEVEDSEDVDVAVVEGVSDGVVDWLVVDVSFVVSVALEVVSVAVVAVVVVSVVVVGVVAVVVVVGVGVVG